MAKKNLKIWLSATSLLDSDCRLITDVLLKPYEVIYSYDLITKSDQKFNLVKHLKALEECDLFLGIIHPKLKVPDFAPRNIHIKEIEHAISQKIPYWYLAHRDVTFTRNLLNDLILNEEEKTESKNKYLFDIQTIKIYKTILNQEHLDSGYHSPKEFFRLNHLLNSFNESLYKEDKENDKKLMLASTVYGFEDQLSKVIEDLQQHQFQVANSHYGSIRVNPRLTNLANCTQAAQDTEWFAGLVRPYYGTGNIKDKNITFEEIKTAISQRKPRWFYIHRDVTFANKVINFIDVKKKLLAKDGKKKNTKKNQLRSNPHIDNECIQLYNYVIKDGVEIKLRNGNWAQEFYSITEAQIYIETQFSDREFIDKILKEEKK